MDQKKELELDRDNFLKAVSAKLDKDSEITVSGYPGLEFWGSSEGYVFHSRIAMDGKRRVYQVVAGIPKSGDQSLGDKCVNSFEILKSITK